MSAALPLAVTLLALRAATSSSAPAASACQATPLPDPAAVERAMLLEEGRYAEQVSDGPRTGQGALRKRLPVMPGAVTPLSDISDGLETYGVPMNLAAFETEAPASEVLHYYAEYFRQRGWDMTGPAENRKTIPYPAVSATDGPEGLQLSVMIMGREPKGSTVILGLADMNAVRQKGAQAWKETQLGDLPLYPRSEPMTLSSRDRERHGLTVNFDTADSVDQVAAFYRQGLTARGYQVPPDPMPSDERVLHLQFVREGHVWSLAISPMNGRTVVTALGTEEASP